jgi:hypothetical protein
VINDRMSSLPMLVLAGILIFVYHFGRSIYYVRGLEPLPGFEFLYEAAGMFRVSLTYSAGSKNGRVKTNEN